MSGFEPGTPLYHGTSAASLASIFQHGLRGAGQRSAYHGLPGRRARVYMAEDMRTAKFYAVNAAQYGNPFEFGAILEIAVPRDALLDIDKLSPFAYCIANVPPEWICLVCTFPVSPPCRRIMGRLVATRRYNPVPFDPCAGPGVLTRALPLAATPVAIPALDAAE